MQTKTNKNFSDEMSSVLFNIASRIFVRRAFAQQEGWKKKGKLEGGGQEGLLFMPFQDDIS